MSMSTEGQPLERKLLDRNASARKSSNDPVLESGPFPTISRTDARLLETMKELSA